MVSDIDNMIKKLNSDTDWYLINLLECKKSELLNITDYSTEKIILTNHNISHTKMKLRQVLRNETYKILQLNKKYAQAKRLTDLECEECKYSITKEYTCEYTWEKSVYRCANFENHVCNSCLDRCDVLRNFIDSMEQPIFDNIEKLLTEDVIKTKFLINTLQNELKKRR